jgi:HTH-type transcriptional regulator/antitoxin MqsA
MRPFVVTYRGGSMTLDLGGYYSDDYDEGIHVGDDMAVSDVALQSLKDEHELVMKIACRLLISSSKENDA